MDYLIYTGPSYNYEGLRPPISKRDWTSAGVASATLPTTLFGSRPTVMSLLRESIAETYKKERVWYHF